MSIASDPKTIVSTIYERNIPMINIRFNINVKGKTETSFPYLAILDSGSNIHQIPKDIADKLSLKGKEVIKTVRTSEGKERKKINIVDNVSFYIWGNNISKSIRYDNERFKIGDLTSDFLVGTPIFKYFKVIFDVSNKLTTLVPI